MKIFTRTRWSAMVSLAVFLVPSLVSAGALEASSADVAGVRAQWEQVNFVVAEAEREHEFRALIETCDALLATRPDDAQALTWCGIVQSSCAGAAGGLGALKHAKAARKHFEHAIGIDRDAVDGAALTSLGTLYARVPGWPVGFGNDKKARQYLEEGLQANPEGMDSNFFMAEFLLEQGQTEAAKQHLRRALQAPERPGRTISDTARRKEIAALLAKLGG